MIELLLLLAVVKDKIFAIMLLTSTLMVAELVSEKSPERNDLFSSFSWRSGKDLDNDLALREFELFLEEDNATDDTEDNAADDTDLALEAVV